MSIDLAFDHVDGERPARAIAFLHGILGRGGNLRTLARRFVEARPDWSAWLVDLRGHGGSPKGTAAPSIEAAARDVVSLASKDNLPLCAIVGHSFGGKVALETLRLDLIDALEYVGVIDSVPGSQTPLRGGDTALGVLDAIESMPKVVATKAEFVHGLMDAGKPRAVAEWLATSLEKTDDGVRFGLDLNEIRDLMLDYFARDLWPVVEHPPGDIRVDLFIAEDSETYSPADRQRAFRIASSSSRVKAEILPGGHWLHVDNPDGLLNALLRELPS